MSRGRAALALAALLAGGCDTNARSSPPNVLLVVIDTLRADHLGSYGYPRPTSPNLDALAARGVRFAQAHSTTSWTAPSVTSILTGLYPAVHGVEKSVSVLGHAVPTMGEAFHKVGYVTAALSSNPLFVSPRVGLARGFDTFEVLEGPPVAPEKAVDMIPVDPGFQSFVEVAKADRVTDAALHWLDEPHRGDRPWFLYLHYIDPHADYFPPPEFAARFGVQPGAKYSGVDQRPLLRTFRAPESADDLATLVGLYDGEIAFTDAHVGRLLEAIEARWQNTLIVVTADHGEEFGDHGRLLHTMTLFEEQLHVPLIIAGAGVPHSQVVDVPFSLVGLWATIADLARIAPPPAATGRSFAAAALGGKVGAEPLFADLDDVSPGIPHVHRHALIDDPWKAIVAADGASILFNLAGDAREHADLAAADAGRSAALTRRIDARKVAAAAERRLAQPQTVELSPEDRARMRALGYGN
jgi:arylsulfatase A-like enzyme